MGSDGKINQRVDRTCAAAGGWDGRARFYGASLRVLDQPGKGQMSEASLEIGLVEAELASLLQGVGAQARGPEFADDLAIF